MIRLSPAHLFISMIAADLVDGRDVSFDELARRTVESGTDWRFPLQRDKKR
jgi:hypothetical protein